MQVRFYATLRGLVGSRAAEIPLRDGATIRELVDAIVERYPSLRPELLDADGSLSRHVHVFVNGRSAPRLPEGLATPLRASDQIELFPAVAGG